MSRAGIIVLIVAAVLVVAGIVVFVIGMTVSGWDIKAFTAGGNYQPRTYAVEGGVHSIAFDGEIFTVRPATDGVARVVTSENDKVTYTVSAADGLLTVKRNDARAWYERILDFANTSATLYLPAAEYGALSVKATTGDVCIERGFTFESVTVDTTTSDVTLRSDVTGDVSITLTTGDVEVERCTLGALSVTVTTGDVELESVGVTGDVFIKRSTGELDASCVTCASFTVEGTTGDASLEDVIAAADLSVECTTGDVELEGVDASRITITTTTGDITGSILTDKSFVAYATTGRVRVPRDTTGGPCLVNATSGNIRLVVGRGEIDD